MGDGIKAGRRSERVKTVDISPTLSRLMNIVPPGEVDGHPLPGIR
jgi:hypothetical protein